MLRFNTFRSGRYLRSKFVEGKYLLASEATDLELELLDLLRQTVKATIGENVAVEDAWKVERLSDTQLLIKPGEAWFKGLPYVMRSSKDQQVSGAILSLGTVPVGTVATDEPSGLGKVITFNSGDVTPTNLYRIVVTAREELITEVDDPFLQNVNLTESTAQKIRLNFQLNIVPESLQTTSPLPYRDESSASLSVTNFPNAGGFAAPNFVNEIVVTPDSGLNGELLALNLISGAEGIDGRDLELVLRNDPGLGSGNPIPNSPTAQQAFSNGKLVDSYGAVYHINAIFNDTVSTQVVIRIDKAPDQPNPQIVNTLPFTLEKRAVFVTDDSNGAPQGRLHWPIATLDWHTTDGIAHPSKVTDLRNSISSQENAQKLMVIRDNLELVGGGNISFSLVNQALTWPEDFSIVNPHGALQTISAGTQALVDGGSLTYEMDLDNGGSIQRGTLSVTVSSGGTTATLSTVDLSTVRLGNVLVDANGDLHIITEIDNVNDTVTAATTMATGAATIYLDSFGPGAAPLTKNSFVLAVRSGENVLVGGEDEQDEFEDRNVKLIKGGVWSWGNITTYTDFLSNLTPVSSSITLANSDPQAASQYIPLVNQTLDRATFLLDNIGVNPQGNLFVEIRTDSAGDPGALVATSNLVPRSAVTGNDQLVDFDFASSVILNSGTTYWIVILGDATYYTGSFVGVNTNSAGFVTKTRFGAIWQPFGSSLMFELSTASTDFTLQWASDAFIQVPGLAESRNTLVAGNVVLNNDGEVAYVNINRDTGLSDNLTILVSPIEDLASTEDLLVIARRVGTNIIVGNQSTLLEPGQSSELYAQMSEEQKAFMGGGPADSTDYSSNNYVTDGSSLETAVGDLDSALASVAATVSNIQWKDPVADFASLPSMGNTDGDVRLVLDTRIAYHWDQADMEWKPLTGTGGGVKIIGGGTLSAALNTSDVLGPVEQNGGPIPSVPDGGTLNLTGVSPNFTTGIAPFNNLGALTPNPNNYRVDRVSYKLQKVGNPTGNIRATIYNSDGTFIGTIFGTSDSVDIATIPTSAGTVDFNFSSVVDLSHTEPNGGYAIAVEYEPGYFADSSNYISVILTTSPAPVDGTYIFNDNTDTWNSSSTNIPNFQVYSQEILGLASGNLSLSFTEPFYIEKAGLNYVDNTVPISESSIDLPTDLDVAYVIPNLSPGGPNLTVTVDTLDQVPLNAIILARRENDDVIVGSSSTRLKNGQSTELYAQESIQSRNTLRSTDFLRSDAPVTWTGTELQFTSDVVLESVNTRTGSTKLSTILASESPLALSDGDVLYVIIDRTAASGNVSPQISAVVPTVISENEEVIIIGKRIDALGAGYLHIPIHKQVLEPGQTVRLGASGAGGGGANSIIETVKNRLLDSTFELATPNVFSVDTDSNVDAASTGNYSLVTKTFDMDLVGETLVSTQLLDPDEFLDNDNFLKEVELLTFWTQGSIDALATYEVSRNGGGEWQAITMERVGTTELFRGIHAFEEEASNAVLQVQDLATSDGELDLDNGTTRERLGQAFVVSNKQLVREVTLRLNKIGSPSGNYKVAIVVDNAGVPGAEILSESALLPLSAVPSGTNNVTVDIPETVLAPGTYHIVVSTDAAYKSSYSNGVTELALRSLSSGIPVATAFDGSSWSNQTTKLVFEVSGIELDLRIRITSGTVNVKLDGYAVLYDRVPGTLATGIKNLEVFQVDGDLNTTDFAINNFLVNPELLRVYNVNDDSVYRFGSFFVNGNVVKFPSGKFSSPGNTITLIFDQTTGGAFDNSDMNGLLLASNHLGSTDATIDRSIAGRGIFLRRPDGTLREIAIDDNDNIVVYSV